MEALLHILTPDNLMALLTLASLEIVLGIDNIVFIAIITSRLDAKIQPNARRTGLLAAMIMRIALLLVINVIMSLTAPWFELFGQSFSGKDLILLGGGLFLLAKATYEIHHKLEASHEDAGATQKAASFAGAITQIMMIDIVFSLDSVITAVGMVKSGHENPGGIYVMIIAIILAVIVMMIFANPVANFIEKHPTMKMLALAFLILIGVMLVAEGFHQHINKGYIYFAMAFSLGVEILNMRFRAKHKPVQLNTPSVSDG
jgi:predicted tellurium resistance membrane protein TerC